MTEQVLKKYFDCKLSVEVLADDLKFTRILGNSKLTHYKIDSIESNDNDEYIITSQHLLQLCNDTINGHLTVENLNTIAFALFASDYFHWNAETEDGEVVFNTLFDWDNPEINYPLTTHNLEIWKKYLETGDYESRTKSLL